MPPSLREEAARHEPSFETPIFYFKPYPGSAIVTEAVERGFRLPDSTGRLVASSTTSRACRARGCHPTSTSSSSGSSSSSTSRRSGDRAARPCCSGSRSCAAPATNSAFRSRCTSCSGSGPRRSCRDAARVAGQSDHHLETQRAVSARRAQPRDILEEHGMSARIIDGNIDRDFVDTTRRALAEERFDAVGVTVMGGPQVPTAIAVSKADSRASHRQHAHRVGRLLSDDLPDVDACRLPSSIRRARPGRGDLPRVAARRSPPGRDSTTSPDSPRGAMAAWFTASTGHSRPRGSGGPCHITGSTIPPSISGHTYLGRRTAGYQAAFGCRFRCTFCGVATMFKGRTALPPAARLDADLDLFHARARRRFHPVLRPQLLRPRGGHAAAARSAG